MTIFDECSIFNNFLFLEVVTLAYLINGESAATNVGIFRNVSARTSQHLSTLVILYMVNTSKPFLQYGWLINQQSHARIVQLISKTTPIVIVNRFFFFFFF